MTGVSIVSATTEVDRRLAAAEALKYGSQPRMLAAAQAAGEHAQTLGDFRRFATALVLQAWAHANLSEYEASLTCAMEVLALGRGHGFGDLEARAINIIALCFVQCGVAAEAARLYEHQLEVGERIGDPETQAMALHDLALIRTSEGETEAAVEMMYRALTLMPRDAHDGLDHSVINANLSMALRSASRLDDALLHAEQSLALAREADAAALTGYAHVMLASIRQAMGDMVGAQRHIEEARACVAADDVILPANIDFMIGRLYAAEGRDRDAVAMWERAYQAAIDGQMLDFAVSILEQIRDAHQRLNDMQGVVRAYQRLTQDIPRQQRQGSDLRFTVLRMVFAMDKAAVLSEAALNQQKSAILHRLSHEFRTPLTIIQSTAELVEKYGERLTLEQRQDRLQRITGQVRWMTVMLEDIVDLLRLDTPDAAALPMSAFSTDDLAREALAGLERYRAAADRVQLTVPDGGPVLHGPLQALTTILVHLLTNALKFSQEGVTLRLSYDGGMLAMTVSDTGIGIPEQDQHDVFKPLVRGSNLSEVQGTGIGLAIVQKLVTLLNGSINLISAEGAGTTITVRVPL